MSKGTARESVGGQPESTSVKRASIPEAVIQEATRLPLETMDKMFTISRNSTFRKVALNGETIQFHDAYDGKKRGLICVFTSSIQREGQGGWNVEIPLSELIGSLVGGDKLYELLMGMVKVAGDSNFNELDELSEILLNEQSSSRGEIYGAFG